MHIRDFGDLYIPKKRQDSLVLINKFINLSPWFHGAWRSSTWWAPASGWTESWFPWFDRCIATSLKWILTSEPEAWWSEKNPQPCTGPCNCRKSASNNYSLLKSSTRTVPFQIYRPGCDPWPCGRKFDGPDFDLQHFFCHALPQQEWPANTASNWLIIAQQFWWSWREKWLATISSWNWVLV